MSPVMPPLDPPPLNLNPYEEVLDHGYVSFVESWGSDETIIESARMSTSKGFLGWGPKCRTCGDSFDAPERPCPNPTEGKELVDVGRGGHVFDSPGDERLLAYLWNNKHSSPFEFAGMTIEVQAPLFVFREWHRHRTQSYAERSARYAPLPDFNYMPTVDRLLRGGGHLNKQAASADGSKVLDIESALEWLAQLADVYEHAECVYQGGLRRGVPKEIARLSMTVGRYSTMRASTDLRNWLGFAALRLPKTAQEEIRLYAEAVHRMLSKRFPRTLELFDKGMQ